MVRMLGSLLVLRKEYKYRQKIKKLAKENKLGFDVRLASDTKIGKGNRIGDHARFSAGVEIKDGVHVGRGCLLERISLGNHSFVESEVLCMGNGDGQIHVGENTYIGVRNILDFSDQISIGDFVHIAGPSTGLWTHSSVPMCLKGIALNEMQKEVRPTGAITIEDNVYIGGNCTIYPGVTIHHHAVVAPNSAVTKDVESYTVVGGVPAKLIRKIEMDEC